MKTDLKFFIPVFLISAFFSDVSAKELKVGIYENRPMVFTYKSGNPGGIFVDVFKEIALKENLKYKFVRLSWTQALEKLKQSEIDIIPGIGHSPQMEKFIKFNSHPVFINWARIYSRGDEKIEAFSDLKRKRIAVLSKDIYLPSLLNHINKLKIDADIIEAENYSQVFTMVRDKMADAAVVNRLFGLLHHNQYKLRKSSIIFAPLEIKFGFATSTDDELIKKIDFHLANMKKTEGSQLNRSLEKYLMTNVETKNNKFMAYLIITGLVFFAFISFLMAQFYKKRAELKHLELESKNRELTIEIKEKNIIEKELDESRQRLNELVETIREVFWVYDVKRKKIDFVSNAFEDIWKRPSGDLYINSNEWFDSIYHEDREGIYSMYKGIFSFKKSIERKYRIVRPDGEIRWIHDRCYLIKNSFEEIEKIVGTAEDITEKKFFEDQLSHSQKMQAIGTMAGGIAHDFNNILGIILGNAELAMDATQKDSTVIENLRKIEAASIRARGIVRQILAFTRKSKMEKEVIDAGEIIIETLDLLRATIPSAISIETMVPHNFFYVIAAPSQINQIIMNLCTNASFALKGVNNGKIIIQAESMEIDEKNSIFYDLQTGSYMKIIVKDNGAGISRDVINRIFDPYFTTKSIGEGSGMGLSVVHGIVKDLKGEILVSGSERKGTEFQIILPLTDKKSDRTDSSQKAPVKGNEKILIVDDEEHLVTLGKDILETTGFRVETSVSPLEALEIIARNPLDFHLLVTDMTMPDMSGLKLIEEVKKISPHLPVILCTGFSDEDLENRLEEYKIDRLLYKPLRSDDLRQAVRSVIDKNINS